MQRPHVQSALAEQAVELLAAHLRAHEHDRLLRRLSRHRSLGAQHLYEHLRLVPGAHRQLELLDRVDRERRRLHVDEAGVIQVAVRQLADGSGHRGGEQRGLATSRREREDSLDVLQKAEVEHLVGLVEHDEATLVQDQ